MDKINLILFRIKVALLKITELENDDNFNNRGTAWGGGGVTMEFYLGWWTAVF